MKLLPCPFCAKDLIENEVFSTRATKYFTHPVADDEDECIAQSIRIPISDRTDDQQRANAWNRRDGTTNNPSGTSPIRQRGESEC
jgi:hypothetical protein